MLELSFRFIRYPVHSIVNEFNKLHAFNCVSSCGLKDLSSFIRSFFFRQVFQAFFCARASGREDRPRIGKRQLKNAFSAFIEFSGYMSVDNLWELRAMPRSTARAALEELTARGFLRKEAVRTGRRGRPLVRYHLVGHPEEAELRFEEMLKQRKQFGTSEADEFHYNTRMEPLGKTKPEHLLGRALDIACADTGTLGAFDTFPKCPRKYGRPDYGSKLLRLVLFADGSLWHGGKEYERQKPNLPDNITERIERTKKRDAQVNWEWEAMGWTVIRYWEEELKDWRAVARRLSEEIYAAINRIEKEQAEQ